MLANVGRVRIDEMLQKLLVFWNMGLVSTFFSFFGPLVSRKNCKISNFRQEKEKGNGFKISQLPVLVKIP